MTEQQYLLNCLAEECHEVGQRALKAARFGLDEVQVGQALTNEERIRYELNDLLAVMHELGISTAEKRAYQQKKKEKLRKYLRYSKDLGVVK